MSALPRCSHLKQTVHVRPYVLNTCRQTPRTAPKPVHRVKVRTCQAMTAAATAVKSVSISKRMEELKQQNKTAFIPFLMAGDPDLATTSKAIEILDNLGADIIELGMPYSDPLADGPVIQAAATRALLDQHVTLDQVLNMVSEIAPRISASLVLFIYFNPITARGVPRLCEQAQAAGISGVLSSDKACGYENFVCLLVPDIPLEETTQIREEASKAGLELILLTTPTTPRERVMRIAKASQGFVYLVSVTGVTGVRATMESRVEGLIEMIHGVTDKSVAVGFGISSPEAVQQVVSWGAEGAIVGSALVKALGEADTPQAGLEAMERLARSLREAAHK